MWLDFSQMILYGIGINFVVYATGFVTGELKRGWFGPK